MVTIYEPGSCGIGATEGWSGCNQPVDHEGEHDSRDFKVEVQENGHTDWISNHLRFVTADAADAYGFELMSRWFGIQDYRVVDTRTGGIVRGN